MFTYVPTCMAGSQASFQTTTKSAKKDKASLCTAVRQILQHQRDLFYNFPDFKKAFDRVWHAGLWQVLRSFNIDKGPVQAIQALYENSSNAVLLNNQLGEFFKTPVGVRQGYLFSPILLNLILEMITTHPSPLVEGPHATYNLPTTSILWEAAKVNFKTSLTDS